MSHQDTAHYTFNQTMIRIKDPNKSIPFYTDVLGFTVLEQKDFESGQFSLYFLTTLKPGETIPSEPEAKRAWINQLRTVLELTHNWGTENDSEFSYLTGNSDNQGFGHLGLSVPDVNAACERFESLGVEFKKKPTEGKMKHIAFIKDPDGYWIEILPSHH